MNNSRTTKKIVGAALLGAAVVGGTAAYAYPPEVSMTASVTSAPVSTGGSTLTVTVNNSNPDCDIRFDVNDVKETVPKGHPVTFTKVLTLKSERGRHSITVKTLGCGGLNKESAKTSFQLLKPHIDTKSSIKAGSKFTVTVKDFKPTTAFTVVATKPGGPTVAPWTGTTNTKGLGKVKIQLPAAGTWSLVASGGGTSATVTILVK